jgi:hypothetical protein
MKRSFRNVRYDSAMDKRIYANIDFSVDRAVCCKPHVSDGAGGRALLYRPVNRAFVLLATTDIRKPRRKVMSESQGASHALA